MQQSSFNQRPTSGQDRAARIRRLNDEFRTAGPLKSGSDQWVVTRGVDTLGPIFVSSVVVSVRDFTAFDEGNDPYGEHDFGSVQVMGEQCFWKIDYYDLSKTNGSPDPADPSVTCRVLTIMLASEY